MGARKQVIPCLRFGYPLPFHKFSQGLPVTPPLRVILPRVGYQLRRPGEAKLSRRYHAQRIHSKAGNSQYLIQNGAVQQGAPRPQKTAS